ncbi:MAG: DNA polymerase III subunit beta, partial [Planctomycetota bacterium]
NSPNPVLPCVVLEADPDRGLVLEATDLDVGIRLRLPDATVEQRGVLVVPAIRLLGVIREVEDEEVTLVGDGGSLKVDSGRSHFRIRGEDPEARAVLPVFPEGRSVTIAGGVLRTMIRRTVFATAKEAGRYALHGVLFRIADGQLELVATDGRRLARVVRVLEQAPGMDLRVIVGPKGLSLLDRVSAGADGAVEVALEERQVLFQVGDALVVSRLIDGTFPSYEDVIPKSPKQRITLPVAAFQAALRRASVLTTRDSISVQFDIGPDLLSIRSRAPEIGEAKVEMSIAYDGEAQSLGFNPGFLTDALKIMDPDATVSLEFTDGKAPGKLTDEENYVYVVMPIALE